jgi:hypothetical protein
MPESGPLGLTDATSNDGFFAGIGACDNTGIIVKADATANKANSRMPAFGFTGRFSLGFGRVRLSQDSRIQGTKKANPPSTYMGLRGPAAATVSRR